MLFFLTLNMEVSPSINFNLFGNVLHRNETNQRRISDLRIIYDGALCEDIVPGSHYVLTKHLQVRWSRNRRASLYSIVFSFHDKIGNMEEYKDPGNSGIPHTTGTFFLFSLRGMYFIASSVEKQLFFERSICILASLQSFIWINIVISEKFE